MKLARKHRRPDKRRRGPRSGRRSLTSAGLTATGLGAAALAGAPAAQASACAGNTYASTIQGTPGLISYWRLGEGSITPGSTVAADQLGANNGIYEGSVLGGQPGAVFCDPNSSVFFDKNEAGIGYVKLPTLNAPVGDFTVEGWTNLATGVSRPATRTNELLFGSYGNERLIVRPNEVTTDVFPGGQHVYNQQFTPNNLGSWVLWDLVRSGSTLTVYRDGVPQGSVAVPTTTIALKGTIGSDPNGYPTDGQVDEVAIYSQALTPCAIQNHYQLGTTGSGNGGYCAAA